MIYVLKAVLFALPYVFYKVTHHDSIDFDQYIEDHMEEVAGGTFAGMTGILEIFFISKAEIHDIYVGVIKALVMSIIGYAVARLVKKVRAWIEKN